MNLCTANEMIFTTRKQSLGQGNVFTPVCHSVHREGWFPRMHHRSHDQGDLHPEGVCIQGGLHPGWSASRGSAFRGALHPGGLYPGEVGQTPL